MLEIIMLGVTTYVLTLIFIFYFLGNLEYLEYVYYYPVIFFLISAIPVVATILIILRRRNRNYIVGFEFDDEHEKLILAHRSSMKNEVSQISIKYPNIRVEEILEKKLLMVPAYKGRRIFDGEEGERLDFITNNFVWDDKPKSKLDFFAKLNGVLLEKEA